MSRKIDFFDGAQSSTTPVLSGSDAIDIVYDNTGSGLTATEVQSAIDEVAALAGGPIDAANIADGSVSNTEFQFLNGVSSAIQTQLGTKAATTLNNVSSTAINADLLPLNSGSRNLGSSTKEWLNVHCSSIMKSGTVFVSVVNKTLNDNAGTPVLNWDTKTLLDGWNVIIKNGVTGSRPPGPVVGQQYFDTTLNIPIWFNGTDWVDATGTVV